MVTVDDEMEVTGAVAEDAEIAVELSRGCARWMPPRQAEERLVPGEAGSGCQSGSTHLMVKPLHASGQRAKPLKHEHCDDTLGFHPPQG